MPHEPGHLLQDDIQRPAPNRLSLAGAVVRNGNSFSQSGGPVTLANAQQSLGINPQLSSLSTVGNSAEELQARQGNLDRINAATNQLREARLGRIASRPGVAGDAARAELQTLGIQPSIARASQINNLADTLAQQRQREQLIQSNLADARGRRSAQDLLLARIQRAGLSDVEEDQRAGALAAELLPQFTQDAPELTVPDLQTQGLSSADILNAQQDTLNRESVERVGLAQADAQLGAAQIGGESRIQAAQLGGQSRIDAALASAQAGIAKELASEERKESKALRDSRLGAQTAFRIFDELETLTPATGPTANFAATLGSLPIIGSIGINNNFTSKRAQFNALASELVLTAAQRIPGVLSDADIALLRELSAQFGASTEANIKILDRQRDLLDNRLLDKGVDVFDERIRKAQQQNPAITPESVAEEARAQGVSRATVLKQLGI